MAHPSGLSRHKHFSEFNSPIPSNESATGVKTPAARKVEAIGNLMNLGDDVAAVVGTFETVTGMVGETFFDGSRYRTRFTCTAMTFGTQADNASLASGLKLFTFPTAPAIRVLGGFMYGTLLGTGSVLTDTPEVGVGTTIGTGANATLGAVAATAEDILGPFVAASINNGIVSGQDAVTGIKAIAAGGTKTVHLNVADAFADITTAGTISFTGVIEIEWIKA